GSYSSSAYIASFIGMVPARAPQLVGAVMVDEPQGAIYGGSVAAPAFQKIVGWAGPYPGISPNQSAGLGAAAPVSRTPARCHSQPDSPRCPAPAAPAGAAATGRGSAGRWRAAGGA